jgi:hypothetical protein
MDTLLREARWSTCMPKTDAGVDAYIKRAAPFAQPILIRIRAAVHAGCPDVEEELKWGVPHDAGLLAADARSLGRYGAIHSVAELPSDKTLVRIVKAAAKLNDAGLTVPRAARRKKPPVRTPPALARALKKSKKALAAYQAFSPSHKREYVEWITEAKGDDTRRKRLETAVAWMAEGKSRNWKYARS